MPAPPPRTGSSNGTRRYDGNEALVKQERQRGGRKRKRVGTAALVAVGLAIAAQSLVSVASLHRTGIAADDVAFLPSRRSQSEKGDHGERNDVHDDGSLERVEEGESSTTPLLDGDERDHNRVPAEDGVHTCQCLPSPPAEPIIGSTSPSSTAKGLRWLHIPKTGTSFFSTLWSYGCTTRGSIDLNVHSFHKNCGPCYDYELMHRYPPEMYCRRGAFADQHTQHRPLSSGDVDETTVVGFFRQPESRLISAYDDFVHTGNCFKGSLRRMLLKECGTSGNPSCYARFPGIAGCSMRMLAGECCADVSAQTSKEEEITPRRGEAADGPENDARSKDEKDGRGEVMMRALNAVSDLGFVGLTEEFNESICQFHKLFGGKPQQGQFLNVHRGKKKHGVEDLDGFVDAYDRVVYSAAKVKWDAMVGKERCYRYLTPDGGAGKETNAANMRTSSSSSQCVPKSCVELGNKQCGEWPDGCGGVTACGLCSAERTGLPETWRVSCVEGKCVPTCTPWVDAGLWFYGGKGGAFAAPDPSPSESAPAMDWSIHLKKHGVPKDLAAKDGLPLEVFSGTLGNLSPKDAVLICAEACHNGDDPKNRNFATQFCTCGSFPSAFLNRTVTAQDYSYAHDLLPFHGDEEALREGKAFSAQIDLRDSQPKCCPVRDKKPERWTKGAIQATFFDHIDLRCGAHVECEQHGHHRNATVVVINVKKHICHLGRDAGDKVKDARNLKRHYLRLDGGT